jgi:hypothetical protein
VLVAYLDESHSRSFFCFAAVIAGAEAIRSLSAQLDELMAGAARDFGIAPGAEIHGYPMFHGKGDWQVLGDRARAWVFERVIDAIVAADVTLVLRGTDSARLQERQKLRGYPDRHTREQVCFQHVLERIDQVAESQGTYALVISDERDDRETHRAHFEEFRQRGTPGDYMTTKLERLLDTVYFAPSHPSRLLQAADVLAFTYHRWNTQRIVDPRELEVMARIRSKVMGSGRLHKPGNWP